jgi:hypothetical protein
VRSQICSTSGPRVVASLLVAALLASALGCTGGLAALVAQFGPALLLLGVLACGLYPGEVVVARIRRQPPVRRRATVLRSPRLGAQVVVSFRARLLAYHLAVRPPPAGAVAA